MALFGTKSNKKSAPEKKAKTAEKKAVATKADVVVSVAPAKGHSVILRPRITEKATLKADAENVFVFEIAQGANKNTVRKAIAALYNVTPVKVSIARNPSKEVFYRGKMGTTTGVKKAYVYLKKGDKIEIV